MFNFSKCRIWSFHVVFQKTARKCIKMYSARAEPRVEPAGYSQNKQLLCITCFTSKSSSMIKQDRFELSSPSSNEIPLTGVGMCEASAVGVSGDCTVNNGKGNMVATPSENSDEF